MEIVSNLQRVFKLVLQGGDESEIKEITPQIKAVPGPLQISRDHGNTEINVDVLENVLNSLEKLLYIFHVSYESKFSVYIEFIFQEIQNLLDYAACNNILSSIPFNQFINVFTLAIKLHISHSCDDKTLVNFHTININKVKSRYNSDCDIFSAAVEELTWRLKLISVFYDIFSHTERHNSNIKNLIKNMGAENVECSLFSKLVTSNSDIVAAQTLLNVIPKYINFSKSNLILQYVWNELTDSMSQKNNSIEDSKIFIILCYLSEFYFVPESNKLMAKILKEKNYWTLLQRGLVNPDSAVRKQALYLMKATLSYCTENGLYGNELQQNLKNLEFCLREDDIENFKELCVIIEYLEEKQVHIIQPIFNLIEKFVEKFVTMKGLSVSWIMVMIQRMLCHDNLKIVRGGISNLLKIPVTSYQTEEEMRTSVKSLIFSLNSTQIYMTELSAILDELKHYFEVSSKAPNGEIFFRILIQEICDKQWSSEALFFIIYSLQSVSSQKFWKREELDLVKNLITCGAANHYTYIKSGMQCQLLLVAINLLDTENVCLEDVAGFLNCFHRKTSLQRGTNLWSRIVNWIKDSYTLIDLENIIVKSLQQTEQRNNVKMILVAYDAYKNNEEFSQNIFHLFRNISESFVNIHIRPYCNVDVQDFYLSVICDILRESGDDLEFLKCFTPSLPEIILYIEWQLGCIHHVKDVQRSQNLLKNLSTILNFDRNRWSLINVVNKWFEKICKLILHSDSYKDFPVKKFIMIRTLNVMVDYSTKLVLNRDILSYLRNDLNSPLVKTSEELSLSKNFQTLWGKMNSEYVEGNWKLLSDLTDSPPDNLGVGNGKFIDLCLEALDIGGYTVLPPLMTVLGKALPLLLNESKLEKLIDDIWTVIMERKKNEEFSRLIKIFIDIVFQEDLLKNESESVQRILIDYSRRLLSDATANTTNAFMKRLQASEGFYKTDFFLDFLPRALLFGQIQKKDERFFSEVCSFIEREGLSPLRNDCCSNAEVRARAVKILLALSSENEANCQFADTLIETIIKTEENISKNKTRYFSDSYIHRVKQRLLQSLLILVQLTPKKSEKLWDWVSNKVITENNQPSVRYLQEWLMLRIMCNDQKLRDSIWTYFDEGLEKRTGSLCSLISIIYHTVKFIPSEITIPWIDTAIQTFLPYCMAQHFSIRLYSQVTLQKLLSFAEEQGLTSIVQKYDIVNKSLYQSIERGNAVKNCAKMQEDFYFTAFHPIEHYSLDTIFLEIPRLTNVSSDEWISEELFKKCGVGGESQIPLKSSNESLKSFTAGKWISEGSKQDNFMGDSEGKENSELTNFQKKIIPVKCLLPDWEELHHSITYSSRKDTDKDGLVVVASLIDRIPNLGGLTRTCEVFGASELVISSLKYTEDKQFQSLSVTAEKWISISEVKPYHLTEYLMKMKEKGYTILAAEQTINSQPLQSVVFPKKSLLLLGNEKEGIPPTLLPLMDICIEIPQVGVIRSLNVHVTGALFVWEYARQHRFVTER